jgi:hypothetical protein
MEEPWNLVGMARRGSEQRLGTLVDLDQCESLALEVWAAEQGEE